MRRNWQIPRRTVLRGAGAAVALPFLDAMALPRVQAATPATAPRRFVGIFGLPNGVVGRLDEAQGGYVAPWTPAETGPSYAPVGTYLKPFADAKVQGKLTILTGLSDRAGLGHHVVAIAGFLTATRPKTQEGDPTLDRIVEINVKGPSADQIAANHLRTFTPVPYLALGTRSKGPRVNHPYGNTISWATATQPIAKDINPRTVFDRIFGGYDPTVSRADLERRIRSRRSVLDAVREHARSVELRLGRSDRSKLDEYKSSLRELELQIDRAGAPIAGCSPSGRPAEPAASLYDDANQEPLLKLLMDVLVKAFECDLTRVATLMFANSWGPTYPFLGITDLLHNVSHYVKAGTPERTAAQKAQMERYTHWALKMYAYFLGELDKRTDPDGGTLLDNAVIYFSGDDCDSNYHTNTSMPVLLGGRGGRTASGAWAVNAGRHVRYAKWIGNYYPYYQRLGQPYAYPPRSLHPGERSVRDLLWGMLKVVGVPNVTRFGDATAPLDLA
jgi:hypothetical protein